MIILHFFPFFNIHSSGGTEVFVKDLANSQLNAGHEVHIFCPNTEEATKIETFGKIRITYFPFPYGTKQQEFISGKAGHRTNQQFVQLVNDVVPDIIHLHGYHAFYHKYISSLPDIYPILFTPHLINTICLSGTLICEQKPCNGLVEYKKCAGCLNNINYPGKSVGQLNRKAFIEFAIVRNSRLIYKLPIFSTAKSVLAQIEMIKHFKNRFYFDALSQQYKEVLKVNGIPENNISSFNNPVLDVNNYRVNDKKAANFIKLLYVGRVSKEKGISVLLDTLDRLGTYKDKFSLTIIGRADDEAIIERLRHLKLSGLQIYYEGEKQHAEVNKAYRNHDYLVFTSSRFAGEMLPLVLQEAMVNELPIISSDIAAAKEIIVSGINGVLYESDNSNDLNRVLEEIITGKNSIRFSFQSNLNIVDLRSSYYDNLYQKVIRSYPIQIDSSDKIEIYS